MTEEYNEFYFYLQRAKYGILQRQIENAKK
jgi:hypothetical protein